MAKHDQKTKLKEFGLKITTQIKKGKNPEIIFPLRNLSNIVYDKKTRTLKLGNKFGTRSFFNVAHAKKFLQTVEVASVIKRELLESGKHEHLRGIFYMVKRTLPGTNVNLVDEQTESLSPDEPVLIRINNRMQFMNGEEILNYARSNGIKIYDDGKKERYTNTGIGVCAFDEDYKIHETPATLVIKNPSNIIKKITTSSGKSVKVTLSHGLFTNKEGLPQEIAVKDLKEGDWIAVPRKIEVNVCQKNIDLVKCLVNHCTNDILHLIVLRGDKETLSKIIKGIDKNKLILFVKNHYISSLSTVIGNWKKYAIPLRLIKELNLDVSRYYNKLRITCKGSRHEYNCITPCNSDLALIIGLLLSEGGHALGKRNERMVTLSNKKKEYLIAFSEAFENCFGEKPAGKILLGKDGVYRLNIGYDLFSYILEFCLEYKIVHSWGKKIPSFLFDADEEVVSTFLKWFRLGDGCITDDIAKLIRFHATSRSLVNGIVFLLLRLGVLSRVYERVPKNNKCHLSYEIRIGNREDVSKVSRFTGNFKGKDITRSLHMSGDRLPHIGNLIKSNAGKIILNERVYKKIDLYSIDKHETICRPALNNVLSLLQSHGEIDEKLNIISKYDIAWDKVVKIEDAGIAPYTIDLAVPVTQNFIGGNGLILLHNSDKAIEDLEVITGLSREQLHVSANKMGSMVGNIILEDSGDKIDCSKLGKGGYSIPSITDEIEFKKVNAKYVLYMEKAAIYERLNEDKFWQKNNCILVTSQGQTTRGIRRLLQRLFEESNMPIYVLTDFDCWGFYIYSVIKYGSIALSHASERLTIPGVKFLGITADDVIKYDLKRHLIKLNDQDIARMKQVSEYEWFKENKDWMRQLKMMKDFGSKAEIQALSAKGISFISETYLPTKIKNKEFLD